MNLGDLIATLDHEAHGESAVEALGDIVLLSQVKAMAETFGESLGAYVATSARRFSALAGDEAWLSLIANMEKAKEPGQNALQYMLRWALEDDRKALQADALGPAKQQACSCGAQH